MRKRTHFVNFVGVTATCGCSILVGSLWPDTAVACASRTNLQSSAAHPITTGPMAIFRTDLAGPTGSHALNVPENT
jgi:hypothetical protein